MRVRWSDGTNEHAAVVKDGTSIVIVEPSVITRTKYARFYDDAGNVHQIPVEEILAVDPDDDLRARVEALERQRWVGPPRLGPRQPTPQEEADATKRMAETIKSAVRHEHEQDAEGRQICTTSGEAPSVVRAKQREEGTAGQHSSYVVLCEEERQKGFVRPYRDKYKHVGERPKYPTSELTPEQHERYDRFGYVAFEAYPADSPESNGGSSTGRYWTKDQLNSGCGTVTTMSRSIAETYARDFRFYGSTFCTHCNKHFPVGEHGQFVWIEADGSVGPRVGT